VAIANNPRYQAGRFSCRPLFLKKSSSQVLRFLQIESGLFEILPYAETISRKYHKQFNNSASGFRAAGFYIKHLKIEKEKLKNGSEQEKH
jgi:hypothetical protein